MIFIITGQKNSGKSSFLYNWFLQESQGYGFISLKKYEGEIHKGYDLLFLPQLMKLNLCNKINTQQDSSCKIIKIGTYIFNERTLWEANSYIHKILQYKKDPIWIDEIGQLEFCGKGFAPILKPLINSNLDLRIGVRHHCIPKLLSIIDNKPYRIIQL